ncbi:MAG: anaerobic ribonucleoside-triphosphate reductase activating protein [Puniceicoccales bacterium]|jgi:pyruvate formate lyase activating enzyme|nr:anaerobic ribonucleoside-triphosphate reductase activating protein [Puniceicoccales bacterium]
MRIGGVQRFSSIDFPGHLAAVVFAVGCNLRCPFCHNAELVTGSIDAMAEEDVLEFLAGRRRQLEGVVISGGEPTLQRDLLNFIEKVRRMGFRVKLDTNGTRPDILEDLMGRGVLDFIAMDVKHRWSRYAEATGVAAVAVEAIRRSVDLIIGGAVDYEFRTTIIRDFHDARDIVAISQQISGAKRYVVQEFIPKKTLDASFSQKFPFEKSSLQDIIPEVTRNVQRFEIRQ